MNKKLDEAIETLRKLPEERQAEWAEVISQVERDGPTYYSDSQREAIAEGIADADAGRFATDEEVEAAFEKFRGL